MYESWKAKDGMRNDRPASDNGSAYRQTRYDVSLMSNCGSASLLTRRVLIELIAFGTGKLISMTLFLLLIDLKHFLRYTILRCLDHRSFQHLSAKELKTSNFPLPTHCIFL